jgi:hypothetical protein
MAAENEGIMSLPQGGETAAAPQISVDDAYDAIRGGLEEASPQVAGDAQGALNSIMPMLDQLDDEQLELLIQAFQEMLNKPEEYEQNVKELIDAGIVDPGMLPEEYDPEILSAILMVFVEARRQRQMGNERAAVAEMPMPPAQMARGGIAEAARMVASKGRNGDTMLAHITPSEAKLLKARGGSGTINPETGLPEFFLKKLVKGVGKAIGGVVKGVVGAVKSIVKSPIGRILATVALATFLGPGAFGIQGLNLGLSAGVNAALASGAVTAIGGGNAKDILRSAATAFLGAPGGPVANYVNSTIGAGAMGITNAAAASAINAGIVGTGVGLLSGQKLADAVKSGLVSGAISGGMTGFQQGFGTQVPGPKAGMVTPATSTDAALQMPGQAPAQAGQAPGTTTAGPLSPLPPGASSGLDQIYGDVAQRALPATGGLDQIYGDVAQRNLPPGVSGAAPGAPQPTVPGGPRPVPGVMDSLGKIGGGITDLLQGNFQQGFGQLKAGAGDLFMPGSATPAQLRETPEYKTALARPGATDTSALAEAGKTYNPSIVRTYGPALAAGMGIMGMTGGFSPKQPPPSELAARLRGTPGEDLIKANPSQYIPQGLPGLKYDERGQIIGSTPYGGTSTMEDIRVETPGIMPSRNLYAPPQYALGSGQPIYAPYNTANMYPNLYYPVQRAADGGIASLAQGGYPRRTGQISGPGTETSDSIPAMLSDGEFVMTAKAVRGAGKGDRRAGAKKMYALMHQLERNASRG